VHYGRVKAGAANPGADSDADEQADDGADDTDHCGFVGKQSVD